MYSAAMNALMALATILLNLFLLLTETLYDPPRAPNPSYLQLTFNCAALRLKDSSIRGGTLKREMYSLLRTMQSPNFCFSLSCPVACPILSQFYILLELGG